MSIVQQVYKHIYILDPYVPSLDKFNVLHVEEDTLISSIK